MRCELLLLSPELKLGHLPSHRQTGHKKKLNTYIGFSELLDMEPFMEQKSKYHAVVVDSYLSTNERSCPNLLMVGESVQSCWKPEQQLSVPSWAGCRSSN